NGRLFLDLTTLKQRKFEFEISESSFPTLRRHLIEALDLPRPADLDPTQSGSEDKAARNTLRKFEAVFDGSDTDTISLRFHMWNEGLVDMSLPTSIVEEMFEEIGKAL